MIEVQRGKTPQVRREIRLRSGQPAKPDELVGAEFVAFKELRTFIVQPERIVIDLPEIGAARPLRTNTIFPVVTVCEAASRPANHRDMNLLHHVHQLRTDAVLVGDLRFLSHPHAVVNHTSDMFGDLAIDVRGNLAQWFLHEDFNTSIGVLRPNPRAGKSKRSACYRRALEKLSPFHCYS